MRNRRYYHLCCEDLMRVDIRMLRHDSDAPLCQYPAGPIAVYVEVGHFRFVHDGLDYLVEVERTRCHYGGGSRPWFLCPSCGDRRAVLYRPPERGSLGCRRCLKLLYLSECDDAFARAIRKVRKFEQRICAPTEGIVFMVSPVRRPKGQHWRTYDRRAMRLLAARAALLRIWRAAQARS
jgi:hypothetical protein